MTLLVNDQYRLPMQIHMYQTINASLLTNTCVTMVGSNELHNTDPGLWCFI